MIAPDRHPAWPDGCWPDATQSLLLKACLLDGPAAVDAWHQWAGRVAWDDVDAGSQKLLPLLYHRLSRAGVGGLGRLKGVVRHQWVKTQLLLRELEAVLRLWRGSGVEAMLLKGAALDGEAYPRGARPMEDLDVFVPRHRAALAVETLLAHGWATRHAVTPRLIAVTHSLPFTKAGVELDLHWDLCHGRFLSRRAQEDLWRHGRVVSVGAQTARVPCPADQLLHACEHGVRYNPTPPLRWLADASLILEHAGDRIDWGRLVAMARRHRMLLPVRETLAHLCRHYGRRVPREATVALAEARPGTASWLEHQVTTRRPWGGHVFWRSLPSHCFHWLRLRRVDRTVGLPEYLRLVNDLRGPLRAHVAELLAIRRGVRATRRRLGAGATLAADLPAQSRHGFHPAEVRDGTAFCWTSPTASAEVPAAAARLTLRLAPYRAWYGDLRETLAVRVDRHRVPPSGLAFDDWRVSFAVPPAPSQAGARRLELSCPPWAEAAGDPRPLGLPLIAIEAEP